MCIRDRCARAEEALQGREKDEYLLLYLGLFIAYNIMTKPERGWEMCIRDRSYNHIPLMIYSSRIHPEEKNTFGGQVDIPVSYTHLDVYKRQRFGICT